MLDNRQVRQAHEHVDLGWHGVRHARKTHAIELGEPTRERKVISFSRDLDLVVRVRPTKPLVGLVGVVAIELLVMNSIDQFTGLSRCLACTLQPATAELGVAWLHGRE